MKRYVKATSKNDLKNVGKELYAGLVKYSGHPVGYVSYSVWKTGMAHGVQIQTNIEDKTKAHGPFVTRLTQLKYHISNPNVLSDFPVIEILSNKTVIAQYANMDNLSRKYYYGPWATRVVFSSLPVLDFSSFTVEIIPADSMASIQLDDPSVIAAHALPSMQEAIKDFSDFSSFLEGYNDLWKTMLDEHSYQDLVSHGISYYFPAYYDRIISDALNVAPSRETVEFWFNQLPEPHKTTLFDMLAEADSDQSDMLDDPDSDPSDIVTI